MPGSQCQQFRSFQLAVHVPALPVGFASMAFSEFRPTVAFGTLAAWTMLGGLIGNLCILPALVSLVDPEK